MVSRQESVLDQVRLLLQGENRPADDELRRRFSLSDEQLATLKRELALLPETTEPARSPASHPGRHKPVPAYTPRHLADKVLTSRAALEGERKRVTVLFVDIRDSVAASRQVDPEDWHRILDGFFAILTESVHAFEGTVNQYTGDGVMALFGAPVAHEDHARRACHAALRIRDELREYASQLQAQDRVELGFRLGLNSGDVVVGKIGDDLRMDYTAHGQVVGVAARMEELAAAGSICVAADTARLVEGLCDLRPLGSVSVRGVGEPVAVYELVAAHPERSRLALRWPHSLARLVGRDAEIGFLQGVLQRVRGGRGEVVAIVGGPGLGKSRICWEFERHCRTQECAVYKAQGVPNGRWLSYFPALSLIRAYLEVQGGDSSEQVRRKVRDKLLPLGAEVESRLPGVYEFLGVPQPGAATSNISPEIRQSRALEFVRWVLARLQSPQPLVLILEDLHWFDDSSREFVAAIMQATVGSRMLVVVNYRPDAGVLLPPVPHHTLALNPLSPDAAAGLVRDLLGDAPEMGEFASQIVEAAGGNPFFIEEIVQDLADNGALSGERGGYRLVRPLGAIKVPSSVQDVLAARVDRLPERDKQVLQAAAVIGRVFTLPVLAAVTAAAPPELVAVLDRLLAADFIVASDPAAGTAWRFKHALTQEAVYRSLLRDKRARLHAAAAGAIAASDPRAQDENAALLAHHWEAAGEPMKAALAYHQAAEWLLRKDVRESLNCRHKVLALLRGQALTPLARRAGLVSCRHLLSWAPAGDPLGPAEAERLFREGCALADRDTQLDLAMLHGAYAIYQAHCDSFERSLELSERCSQLLHGAGLSGLQVFVDVFVKPIAYSSAGRPREEHAICEHALALMRRQGVPEIIDGTNPLVWTSSFYAMSVADLGDLPRGLELLRQGAQLARASTDIMLVHLLGLQSRVRYFMGTAGDAEACAHEACEFARQCRAEHWLAHGHFYLAIAHVLHEQWAQAHDQLEQARRHSRRGEMVFAVYGVSTAWLAYVLARMGDTGRCDGLLDEAMQLAGQRRNLWILQDALMMRSAVLRETTGASAAAQLAETVARWEASVDENGAEMYRHLIWLEKAGLAAWADERPAEIHALEQALAAARRIGAEGYAARIEGELRGRR